MNLILKKMKKAILMKRLSMVVVSIIILTNFLVIIPDAGDSAELHHVEDDSGGVTENIIDISRGDRYLGNICHLYFRPVFLR